MRVALVKGPETQERAKRLAALEAARMAQPGWVVGLGTGSTSAYAIEELGRRMREEGVSFLGVPTSYSSEALARLQGIPIAALREIDGIDLAIDGADEVDPHKDLIKGAGGAHTREKVVDSFARLFVVVVDETKLVDHLGEKALLPVEVLPMAEGTVTRRLREMGGLPYLRTVKGNSGSDDPFITEEGNMILDVRFSSIEDPRTLECALNNIPGVVENGLFAGKAHLVLVGSAQDGSVRRIE